MFGAAFSCLRFRIPISEFRIYFKPLLPRPVQNHPPVLRCQSLERLIAGNARAAAEGLEHCAGERLLEIGPEVECALSQRELGITQQSCGIRTDLHAEAF